MSGGLTVKALIAHLQKYPSNLMVSIYRPPFTSAFRVVADPKAWLYNTRRLYIPTKETRSVKLPGNYKMPKFKRSKKKDE